VLIYQKGFEDFSMYLIQLIVYGLAGLGAGLYTAEKEITD